MLLPNVESNATSAATPSEVKKTVDALAGRWTFGGTDVERGGATEPAKVTMEIDCKPAALGAAVGCTLIGSIAGFGPVEATAIVGYSPDEQAVRWMEISSTGEYHDHRGKWAGNAIKFEPLTYAAGGKKCTEEFSLDFPSRGKMVLKSVTVTSEGLSKIDGTAEKQ